MRLGPRIVATSILIGLVGLPSAAGATGLDLTVSGLWIQSVAYSVVPFSGSAGGGIALNLFPASAVSIEAAAALPSDIGIDTPAGSVRLRAYTLTAKYHFLRRWRVSPYIGGGAYHSQQSLDTKYTIVGLDSSSNGWVAQAGLDCRIASRWFARVDVRYLGDIGSTALDVTSRKIPLSITPVIVGLGVGLRIN